MEHQASFSYWKKPWVKWLFLTAGLLQIPTAWGKLREYQLTAEASILSAEELKEYLFQQRFSCMINVMCVVLFLGLFLIDLLVHSKKSAHLSATLLFTVVASLYTVGLFLWSSALPSLPLLYFFLCLLWGSVLFTFWQFLKEVRKH